jgi:hypothetical protein
MLIFLLACGFFAAPQLQAFEFQKEKPKWGFSGWVKNTTYWDSRQVDGVRDDDYSLFPKDRVLDVIGNDINDVGDFDILAIDSTVSLTVGNIFIGGKNHGVELTGEIVANFLGIREVNINEPQLTFGYLALNWERSQLLMGQYLTPLYVVDATPHTVSYGYGAPIEPFVYLPEVRFTHRTKSGWEISLSANSEMAESASVGFEAAPPQTFVLPPTVVSTQFLRNAKLPILGCRCRKQFGEFTILAGAQYRKIRPRLTSDAGYKVHEHVNAVSAYLVAKVVHKPVVATFKLLYTQNGYADGVLGTYGIRSIELPSHRFTYAASQFVNAWVDVEASDPKWLNPGVFAGFLQNLGTTHPLFSLACDPGYGFTSYKQLLMGSNLFADNEDLDVDWLVKIIPRVYFIFKSIQIGAELEYNRMSYGVNIDQRGKPIDTHIINHARFLMGMFYYF